MEKQGNIPKWDSHALPWLEAFLQASLITCLPQAQCE